MALPPNYFPNVVVNANMASSPDQRYISEGCCRAFDRARYKLDLSRYVWAKDWGAIDQRLSQIALLVVSYSLRPASFWWYTFHALMLCGSFPRRVLARGLVTVVLIPPYIVC